MAKTVINKLKLDRAVKHSVVYKPTGEYLDDQLITTGVYISKEVLGGTSPFPEEITLTLEIPAL